VWTFENFGNLKISDPKRPAPCLKLSRPQAVGDIALIPCADYPDKAKVYIDRGIPLADMTARNDVMAPAAWTTKITTEHVQRHLPGLDSSQGPGAETTCIFAYTQHGSSTFFMGPHPKWSDVIVAGPVGSTGFMFAPAVGRVVASLVERGAEFSHYDITPFRVPHNEPSKL